MKEQVEALKKLIEERMQAQEKHLDNIYNTILRKLSLKNTKRSLTIISGLSQHLHYKEVQFAAIEESIISLNEILKTVDYILTKGK